MATKQRCPKCTHLNELDAARCGYCNAPLVITCPTCGTPRPWYVQRCSVCESRTDDAALFAGLFRDTPDRRLAGRYLVKDVLASGATSAVYRAVDARDVRVSYAVKELSPVALIRPKERQQAEQALDVALRRWSRVQHPALPALIDSFKERDKHYVVFELIRGWTLAQVIEERRVRISPDLARNWGAQICDLLITLHAESPPLYVPFLSPDHVMVTPDGRLYLVGLGLGHPFRPNATMPMGAVRGYAAPELINEGTATVQSDLFAVGRLLYALLVGRLLEKGLPGNLPLRRAVPGISDQLVKAIARAARRDPAQRYHSAAEFREALWSEAYGLLEPIADWARPPQDENRGRVAAVEPEPSPAQNEMTAYGFTPDPRYRPEAAAAAPAPQPQTRETVRLSIYPQQLRLTDLKGEETRKVVLSLRNTGQTEATFRIVSHVEWISAPKKTVRLPAGKQARVILTVRALRLPAGRTNEPQALSVETDAGRKWVGAVAEVMGGPSLHIEPAVLDFGTFDAEAERSLTLIIQNPGRETLTARIMARVPWLRAPREDMRCPPGGRLRVPITAILAQLPRGPQVARDALVVDSDGGQERVEARAWRRVPELDLGATHMDFGTVLAGESAERYLFISNPGDGPLEGNVRSMLAWLQAYPQTVRCEPGEMVQITVRLDAAGLPDGALDIPRALQVQTNAGGRTLSLHVQVSAPRLVLATPEIDFGSVPLGEIAERRLVVRNEGSAPLEATLTSAIGWIQPATDRIECAAGSEVAIPIRAQTVDFTGGQEIRLPDALRIVSGSDIMLIPVQIAILQPALQIEPEAVDFGYIDRAQPETRTLSLTNAGTGSLAWDARSDALWVEVTPQSGVCTAGETQTITMTAYGLALEAGQESATANLVINSDGGRAKVPLRVGLASPLIAVDTMLLDLGVSVNMEPVSGAFRIFNHGLGMLQGTISVDQTWLALSQVSFECATGRSIEVRVTTDMEEFPRSEGRAHGMIHVESNGGSAEIEVVLAAEAAPRLELPDVLSLEPRAEDGLFRGRLVIRNTGMATAHARLVAGNDGLTLSRQSCDVKPNKSARIGVQWTEPIPSHPEGMYIDVVLEDRRLRVPVEIKVDDQGRFD
jgi:serine/threonine protein kinase